MVIVKSKIQNNNEIMLIGSYIKIYADLVSREVIMEMENGARLHFAFYVFDDAYPKKETKYYENYLTSTIMEFLKDVKRNLKVRMIGNVKGDVAFLGLEVRDLSFRKRKIPVKVEVYVEYDLSTTISNLKISYDDLRNAIVVSYMQDNQQRVILIGNHQRELKIKWHYAKNIHVKPDAFREHIATLDVVLNERYDVFELFVSDDVDHYDQAYLLFSHEDEKEDVLDTNIGVFKRVYNYFYNYLNKGLFSDDLINKLVRYYLHGVEFDTSHYKIRSPYLDDVKGKKPNWMSLADENILGKSLLHSLLLANKLVDDKHYEEAYKVLKNYAESFYDILNFSLVDKLRNEKRFTDQALLFLRVFNKMFFSLSFGKNTIKYAFYVPKDIEYVDFRDMIYGKINISNLSFMHHGGKTNFMFEFSSPYVKYRTLYLKKITSEGIEEKKVKLNGSSLESINLWI